MSEEPKPKQDERRCRYCEGLSAEMAGDSNGWTDEDLAKGYRWEPNTKVYHCYPAYVED